jgi:HlyD family secretion protein
MIARNWLRPRAVTRQFVSPSGRGVEQKEQNASPDRSAADLFPMGRGTRRLCLGPMLALTLILSACSDDPDGAVFQGYVEGEFIEVAPEVGGRIVELAARRGDQVEAGAFLFRLDDEEAAEAVAQAEAELARAEAQLANLQQGQRPTEIAVIEAQIAEAQASLDAEQRDFQRQLQLFERNVIAEARLDQAREEVSVAEARLAAVERQRDVAEMPARTAEIDAGERAVEGARAALRQAKTRLARHIVTASHAGRIEDVHYEEGEVATAGAPVLSLLPPDRRKVIFFVPEPVRPALAVGRAISIACDGCPDGLSAHVNFLASEAEFTPPVIFSRDTREKLVFRAEAALDGDAAELPLGQPVDVAIIEAAQ